MRKFHLLPVLNLLKEACAIKDECARSNADFPLVWSIFPEVRLTNFLDGNQCQIGCASARIQNAP